MVYKLNTRYTLVCDAGSTKTQAALYDSEAEMILANETVAGVNPVHQSEEDILIALSKLRSLLKPGTGVLFFGSGCLPGKPSERIESCFRQMGADNEIRVESDLTGACLALLGNRPGIACILGTGSNSALWDGKSIVRNVPPLGYVLGDEGSGTALGKQLVRDILRGGVSQDLQNLFYERTKYDRQSIIESVYRKEGANKYLSSLAYFLSRELNNGEVQAIVIKTFDRFFTDILGYYPDSRTYPLSFTGSIAKVFEKQLRLTAEKHGYAISSVCSSPMPGIIDYLRSAK